MSYKTDIDVGIVFEGENGFTPFENNPKSVGPSYKTGVSCLELF